MSSSPTKTALLAFDPSNLAADDVCISDPENDAIATSSAQETSVAVTLDILPYPIHHSPPKDSGSGVAANSAEYYQLNVLNGDLEVSEILVASEPACITSNPRSPDIIQLSDAVETVRARVSDGFVALDEEVDSVLAPALKRPSSDQLRCSKSGISPVREDPWTLNLAWLHKELKRQIKLEKISFAEALQYLTMTVEQISSDDSALPKSL